MPLIFSGSFEQQINTEAKMQKANVVNSAGYSTQPTLPSSFLKIYFIKHLFHRPSSNRFSNSIFSFYGYRLQIIKQKKRFFKLVRRMNITPRNSISRFLNAIIITCKCTRDIVIRKGVL